MRTLLFQKFENLLRLSYTGQYIINRKCQIKNILKSEKDVKSSNRSVELGFFILAVFIDILIGVALTVFLQEELVPNKLAKHALTCTDQVVSNLQR